MALLIVTIVFTLLGSFFCSMLEATILSVSPAYIELGVQDKKRYARRLQSLKGNLDRSLAAILTVNTLANTLGSVIIGAQINNLWGNYSLAIASTVLTLVILIFCEIIPKTLGASRWKAIAPFAAYAIPLLIAVSLPVVKLSEWLTQWTGAKLHHKVTREEMIVTAEMGAEDGTLNKKETTIIKNLLMLENMFVSDIMTPRSVLFALPWTKTIGETMREAQPIRYSRVPLYNGDLDRIEGFIHRYKILEAYSADRENLPLRDLMLPIHSVPESITVSAVLDQLIHRNEHIFIVVNDYGSVTGIVTLEDAIETLLGVEIVDEFDSVVDLRQHALDKWRKRKRERVYTANI